MSNEQAETTTWYEACAYCRDKIKPVRVLRETTHQIILADRTPGNARRAKQDTYFPTWKAAHDYLTAQASQKREGAARNLAKADSDLAELASMKEPSHE
jgi:hypothetical protein